MDSLVTAFHLPPTLIKHVLQELKQTTIQYRSGVEKVLFNFDFYVRGTFLQGKGKGCKLSQSNARGQNKGLLKPNSIVTRPKSLTYKPQY